MNMKNILRLMGALTLTIGTATSVVACDQSSVAMNTDVSKQLGLTDDKGQGVQEATLDISSKADAVIWSVPALATPITAAKLLTTADKAADQSCFDFITNVLTVKPKTGSKLDDGVFDNATLTAITGEVTQITPTLKKMDDNKDYAITGGTFSFQFKKGNEKLGDLYSIKLKADSTKGVVNVALTTLVAKIKATDTDVADNTAIQFEIGKPVPEAAKTPGVAIKIQGTTDVVKQFNALNTVTGLKITAQLGEITAAGNNWAADDTLKIVYKAGDVTFAAETTLTLATA
ncbi:hypothetical protein [Spiroplasma endosymbiont of Polydrusus pterygomalis]|uniref:hypothetical protein n=1 Tax=Spiroplasma endosymbiont of Polydrusus pterygomalis TaxID=3139327 RepID=UPI003CCB36B4